MNDILIDIAFGVLVVFILGWVGWSMYMDAIIDDMDAITNDWKDNDD